MSQKGYLGHGNIKALNVAIKYNCPRICFCESCYSYIANTWEGCEWRQLKQNDLQMGAIENKLDILQNGSLPPIMFICPKRLNRNMDECVKLTSLNQTTFKLTACMNI